MSQEMRSRLYSLQRARDELNQIPRAYENEHVMKAILSIEAAMHDWPLGAGGDAVPSLNVPALCYTRVGDVQISQPTLILSVAQAEEMGLVIVKKGENPPGRSDPPAGNA